MIYCVVVVYFRSVLYRSLWEHIISCNSKSTFYAPPQSGVGHIVLPLSVCTSVTLLSTVLVSATPPKVFDAGTWNTVQTCIGHVHKGNRILIQIIIVSVFALLFKDQF